MLSANNMLTTGGRRQRQRGTVRVSEPANGFFIAGSSIDGMNGVYIRKNAPRVRMDSTDPGIALYYEHEDGLWHMALKELSPDQVDEEESDEDDDYFYRARKRKPEHEWVFMDQFGRDRFRHEGDTIVPGAGVRWKHIHRPLQAESTTATTSPPTEAETVTDIATIAIDDEDELPWQVIAILDWETVQELVWSSEYRKNRVRDAQMGKTAKKPAQASLEASFAPGCCWLFRVVAPDGADLFLRPDDSGANEEVGHVESGQYLRGQELSADGEWLLLDKREADIFLSYKGRMRMQQSRSRRGHLNDESDESDEEDTDEYSGFGGPYFNVAHAPREVWVRVWTTSWGDKGKCYLLEEVLPTESAVMDIKQVGEPEGNELDVRSGWAGDVFDRPFVPRMEEGVTESDALSVGQTTEEVVGALDSITYSTEDVNATTVASGVPLGAAVSVCGLTSRSGIQYNGVSGVVVGELDTNSGRLGVRLDTPFSGKLLSCKPSSLVFAVPVDEDAGHTHILNGPARILGLTLAQLGLIEETNSVVSQWGPCGDNPTEKVSVALRAAVRDVGSSLRSPIREAARESAQQMFAALSTSGGHSLCTPTAEAVLECSPEGLVRRGALGCRAAAAIVSAFSRSSLSEREEGLKALQGVLHDEIFRSRAMRDSVVVLPGEDSAGVDEWLLRLGVVQALMECRREAEALEEVQRAAKFVETEMEEVIVHASGCTQLLLGTCLLRRGQRADGLSAIQKALRMSTAAYGRDDCQGQWLAGLSLWSKTRAEQMLHVNGVVENVRSAAIDSYARGSFEEAAVLYGKVIATLQIHLPDDKRGRATALADRAGCLRRARRLNDAVVDLDAALRLFPHYTRAIYRRAACLLEAGKATDALEGFKDLYRVDRNWPNLSEWLVRAFSLQKRQARGYHKKGQEGQQFDEEPHTTTSPSPTDGFGAATGGVHSEADVIAKEVDHYTVLGVSTDATEKQLKTAYRMRSLKFHPDKKGGHTAAFQRIAEAYEVLADSDKRQVYDEGGDIRVKRGKKDADDDDSEEEAEEHKTSLREEVEREFYPERYHFWPFGDPFVYKRKREAQKRAKEGKPAWGADDDWGA